MVYARHEVVRKKLLTRYEDARFTSVLNANYVELFRSRLGNCYSKTEFYDFF